MSETVSKNIAVCLGSFDGLHSGHRAVISNVENYSPLLLTFEPHPVEFFTNKKPPVILQEDLKKEMLNNMGATMVKLNFKEIYAMSAEDFFEKIIIDIYHPKAVSCGYNYRFGKNAAGDTSTLKTLCDKHNIPLYIAEKNCYANEAVSSTRIRKSISYGDIVSANNMLGYNFTYKTEVVYGNQNGGKLLGFPTANQILPENFVVPKFGAYKSNTLIDNKWFESVTNIGVRPTLDGSRLFSETHIINFSGNLYGKKLQIQLTDFIRPEIKFNSFEELKEQIKTDILSL